MFEPDNIELSDGQTLTVKKVTNGMFAVPDAYQTLKEDFFKALDKSQPVRIANVNTDNDLFTLETNLVSPR